MRSAFFKDLLCTVGHFPWRCFWCFVFLLLSPLLQQRQVLALARQQQMKQGLLPSCRFLSSFLRHAVMLLIDAVAAVASVAAVIAAVNATGTEATAGAAFCGLLRGTSCT